MTTRPGGVPIKAVPELLGHSSIEVTMRYAHLAPNVKRDSVELLDEPVPQSGHYLGIGDAQERQKAS